MSEENKQVLYRPVKLKARAKWLEGQWAKVLVTNKWESKILDTQYEDGNYVACFLPRYEGKYNYVFQSNFGLQEHGTMDVEKGYFHGQIQVQGSEFLYQDGTIFHPFGTEELYLLEYPEEDFKFCIHDWVENGVNLVSFLALPSEQEELGDAYWEHLEEVISGLQEAHIQAELILFKEGNSPIISRLDWLKKALKHLSIYTNIWWNLGNAKQMVSKKDFDSLVQEIVKDQDHRVLSVISKEQEDMENPAFTHIEWNAGDHYDMEIEALKVYHKPLIVRSYGYEGRDIDSIMSEEVTRRMWDIVLKGAYLFVQDSLLKRLSLLATFVEKMKPVVPSQVLKDTLVLKQEEKNEQPSVFLRYFGYHTPSEVKLHLDAEEIYQVETLDTWHLDSSMDLYHGQDTIELQGDPYMALLVQKGEGMVLLKEAYDYDEENEEPVQKEVVVETHQLEHEKNPDFLNVLDFALPDVPAEKDLIDELKDSLSLNIEDLEEDETKSISLSDSLQLPSDLDLVDDELPDIVTQTHSFELEADKEDSLEIPSIRFHS